MTPFTYDGFGNPVDTKIAGKTVSANSYAPNNGTHTGTTYADGSRTSQDRDAYGRVIRSYITDAGGTRHQTDATVYDNDGNVKKYTDTANSLTTEYDYDDAGRVARSTVKKENSSAYNGSGYSIPTQREGKSKTSPTTRATEKSTATSTPTPRTVCPKKAYSLMQAARHSAMTACAETTKKCTIPSKTR